MWQLFVRAPPALAARYIPAGYTAIAGLPEGAAVYTSDANGRFFAIGYRGTAGSSPDAKARARLRVMWWTGWPHVILKAVREDHVDWHARDVPPDLVARIRAILPDYEPATVVVQARKRGRGASWTLGHWCPDGPISGGI